MKVISKKKIFSLERNKDFSSHDIWYCLIDKRASLARKQCRSANKKSIWDVKMTQHKFCVNLIPRKSVIFMFHFWLCEQHTFYSFSHFHMCVWSNFHWNFCDFCMQQKKSWTWIFFAAVSLHGDWMKWDDDERERVKRVILLWNEEKREKEEEFKWTSARLTNQTHTHAHTYTFHTAFDRLFLWFSWLLCFTHAKRKILKLRGLEKSTTMPKIQKLTKNEIGRASCRERVSRVV